MTDEDLYRAPLTTDYMSMSGMSESERMLLTEYQRLARNLQTLSQAMNRLATVPTPQILDTLRELESKTALVSTLLKASVYSMFVQNEDGEETGDYNDQGNDTFQTNQQEYFDPDFSTTEGY